MSHSDWFVIASDWYLLPVTILKRLLIPRLVRWHDALSNLSLGRLRSKGSSCCPTHEPWRFLERTSARTNIPRWQQPSTTQRGVRYTPAAWPLSSRRVWKVVCVRVLALCVAFHVLYKLLLWLTIDLENIMEQQLYGLHSKTLEYSFQVLNWWKMNHQCFWSLCRLLFCNERQTGCEQIYLRTMIF